MAVNGSMTSVVINDISKIHATNHERFPSKLMSEMSLFPKCRVNVKLPKHKTLMYKKYFSTLVCPPVNYLQCYFRPFLGQFLRNNSEVK